MLDFAKIWHHSETQSYDRCLDVKEADWLKLDRKRQDNHDIQRTVFF